MGVRGLFTFAENKSDCFESVYLKDTQLVIDGNNLRFFLYKGLKKRKCSFGGEYSLYFSATQHYFKRYVFTFIDTSTKPNLKIYFTYISSLLKNNIEPIVIFDGSYEEDKKKTKWKRTREQLHAAIRQVPTMDGRDAILPIFSKGDLLRILVL